MAKRKMDMELPSVIESDETTTTTTTSKPDDVRYVTITVPVKELSAAFESGNRKNPSDIYVARLSRREQRVFWMMIEAVQSLELLLNNGATAANKSNVIKWLLTEIADAVGVDSKT